MSTARHALLIVAMLVSSTTVNADPQQLFNRKDLGGWEHVGSGRFVVEDGLLKAEGGVGLLWFKAEKFGDAVVRVVYKLKSRKDNRGVFIRISDPPEDPWMPVNKGLEVQINDAGESGYYSTGSIYTFSEVRSRWTVYGSAH